jgi:hypothetical protein
MKELIANFKLLNLWFLPVIFLFLTGNYIVSSIRWKNLLIYHNTEHITVKYLTYLYFIGSFFNNFMPTSIGGDVYKVYKLGKKIGDTTNAFSATFMERFTGVIALVLISSGALIYLLKGWGVLLFIGFWIGLVVGLYVLKFLSKKFKAIDKIYSSLIKYKDRRDVILFAFVTSIIVQLLSIFTQYLIFTALGHPLPLFYSLFIFPIIILASFFIPSLNGVGVQDGLYALFFGEMTYIALFGGVGVGTEVAVSASIIFHLSRLFVSLFGGLLYATGKAD